MKQTRLLLPLLMFASASTQAAVVLQSHYGLGEAGTVGASAPFLNLVDSVATGGSQSLTASNMTTQPSVGTVGITAPGSTAYLQKPVGSLGWSSSTVPLALTTDWATQIWMRPNDNGGTIQFETDNSPDGVSIWFQNGADGNGTDIAFGHGNGGTGGTPNGNLFDYVVGTWYRIGIVNYNGTNNFYVNGAAVGTDTLGGTFSQLTLGFAQGGINGGAGGYDELNVWSFDHNTDSLASVTSTMNAVPEPASTLLGGLGMLCLLRRRR